MEPQLQQELQIYHQNKDRLLSTDSGKFALIYKDQVIGTYDTRSDAVAEGYRRFGNVPFLTKEIVAVEKPVVLISGLVEL